ncbi:hypothetical protein BC834DRAFT_849840 [Gloeopeniophorella convolvens]|nr:hypothetical protein BC834DRAFT_849840 [Gloeopeniophorella convolvens]
MTLVACLALWILHLLYSAVLAILSIRSRHLQRAPRPLTAARSKVPSHLAIVLASQDQSLTLHDAQEVFLQCAEKAIACCRAAGIHRLSIYDRQGILLGAPETIRERLDKCLPPPEDELSLAEAVFPLTPPLSDDSDVSDGHPYNGKLHLKTIRSDNLTERRRKLGRVKSGIQRHRKRAARQPKPFMLHLVSRDSGKPTIAAVTDSLLRSAMQKSLRKVEPTDEDMDGEISISVSDFQSIVEGDGGFGPPDLMVVHDVTLPKKQFLPLELHSFPPWQVRLTEIYYNGFSGIRNGWLGHVLPGRATPWIVLSETDIRRALDEYSSAEFRLGK